jgi:hypothetical protein
MAFWLVETTEQLQYLQSKKYTTAFVEIISLNDNAFPLLNEVALVYFKPLNSTKGFILCINHTESLSLNKTQVSNFLKQIPTLWVRDKKNALYYFPFKSNFLDINFLTPTLYTPTLTITHKFIQNKHPQYTNINTLIPIVKHYEYCEKIYTDLQSFFTNNLPKHFHFYNDKVTLAFFGVEKNGIQINKDTFNKHYEPTKNEHSIINDTVYSHYNLYTTTRRPSNAFNGINFAALNKDSGARASFVSSNYLVEFDISAYHPQILARLINFDFGHKDVHQTFADMYNTTYEKAKELTFKQLYGGIFKEYEHLEFFQKIQTYKDNIWKEYNNLGQVIVPISSYCFEKVKLNEMNPQKLLNYFIQNVETSLNTLILLDIHKLLLTKKSKIVLYVYDSFMFDIVKGEEYLVKEISKIFTKYKLNVKTKYGKNYDKMKKYE